METFTSEFVYHYDVALPKDNAYINGAFLRKSIILRLKDMKCDLNSLFVSMDGRYLYAWRPLAKDYVRIGLY